MRFRDLLPGDTLLNRVGGSSWVVLERPPGEGTLWLNLSTGRAIHHHLSDVEGLYDVALAGRPGG